MVIFGSDFYVNILIHNIPSPFALLERAYIAHRWLNRRAWK